MKTSRRKFFGLMGGAAVAGPTAAKNAIAKLPGGLLDDMPSVPPLGSGYIGSTPSYPADAACNAIGGRSWHLEEIARLRRFISGDLTDEEKEERRRSRLYSRQQAISNHWAGMQSVAGWRKLDLFHRDMELVNDEIARSHSQGYLTRLLKENGL